VYGTNVLNESFILTGVLCFDAPQEGAAGNPRPGWCDGPAEAKGGVPTLHYAPNFLERPFHALGWTEGKRKGETSSPPTDKWRRLAAAHDPQGHDARAHEQGKRCESYPRGGATGRRQELS
jgi:hypothetical protein